MRDEPLLSPTQVAERLQVSEYTAVKWMRQGRIKARKLGKFWRVKPEDLETFIEGGTEVDRDDAAALAALNEALADPVRIPHEQVRRALGL
jgi:excisionase family DNA binding protein